MVKIKNNFTVDKSKRVTRQMLQAVALLSWSILHQDVLQKLRQFCSISTGTTGRIYRPREGRRLVLYLKDINLPTPDKYDTSEIIMFLQQAVMHKGFYDDDLEFVQLEHIQIVASIAPASTLGRHRLSTRFTAIVRVCSISYPSSEELTEARARVHRG